MERLLRPVDAERCAHWADALIGEFGSLGRTLAASFEAVTRVTGDPRASETLAAVAAAIPAALRERVEQRPFFGSPGEVVDYLRGAQAHSPVEVMRVLFFDAGNCLLRQELVTFGTIDEAPLHAREIIKRCLELDAAGLVLAHNHPSGDHTPSRADIAMTRQIAAHCQGMGIHLLDHIVVSDRGYASFKALGLL